MKHLLLAPALAVLGYGFAAQAATPPTYAGQQLASHAKVSMAVAQATALKVRPGAITDKELERESDGSGLRYSFDIKASGKTYEVGIDAQTGKVLENKAEGKNPD